MHRRVISSFIAVIAIAMLAACGGSSAASKPTPTTPPAASAFPVTISRSDGKSLTLQQPPARLVSFSPGATEIIYAIGAGSELAAVDKNADYPAEAKNFPTKLDAYEPNVEAIAALKPDLVFVASDPGGLVDALDRLQIPVLWSDLNDVKSLDDVLDQITLVGKATGKTAEADALITSLRARIDAVTNTASTAITGPQPAVYHEVDSTFYSISDGTFIGDLYRIAGARNIAGDGGGTPYPQLTQEAIIAANPQVIVLADEPFGTTADSVKQRAGWQNIDAVRNNRVYAIDPDIASRAGPRIVDALEQIASFVRGNAP